MGTNAVRSKISTLEQQPNMGFTDMVAQYVSEDRSYFKEEVKIPIIYPFDFEEGAGAIVSTTVRDSRYALKR
jgi:hypothetical protein